MRTAVPLLIVLAWVRFAPAAEPASVPGDAQDLVLFLEARPCLIRLHLQIHGRSFRQNWNETVGHLFRYLDVDRDGALSEKEAAFAPSKSQWVQLMTGDNVEPDSAPDFPDSTAWFAKKRVTQSQFEAYYRDSGAGALQIEWSWRNEGPDAPSNALLQHLDKNKDGYLSKAELLAAASTLASLDINGDELIQEQELNPANGNSPTFTTRAAIDGRSVPKSFPFLVLPAESKSVEMAEEMLRRHDKDKDRHLSRTEFPLDAQAFDRLDADRDGKLNAAELAEWRKLNPDLEAVIPLEPGAAQEIRLLPKTDGKSNRLAALLPSARDGAMRIPLAEKQLELARSAQSARIRRELLKQFDDLAGKDAVLAEKQIYQPPFVFVALLRLADRDGDNRLTRRELVGYLDLQEKFLFRTSYLTVVDRGASLFEFLDADHDRRLSPRELRTAWSRLSAWDRDKTGRIEKGRIPQQFQMILGYGAGRVGTLDPQPPPGFAQRPSPFRDSSDSPVWFRKMDRNGDGDVSQTEFLGTAEQFRLIDADGDGLIDPTEAKRADEKVRKKSR